MRAVPLKELRELLQGQAFAAWWADFEAAVSTEREARVRADELGAQHRLAEQESEAAQRQAIDTFSEAGGAEEEAVRVGAEAQAHEVRALEQVGRFEEQRFRASDVWYRLGGVERTVELRREQLAALDHRRPDAEKQRVQAEAALRIAERQLRGLQDEYGEEDRKRTRLWEEVEAVWEKSFERSLLAAEHSSRSRRIIRQAEQLFREADEKRTRSRQLREEAEQVARALAEQVRRRGGLLEAAGDRFGCLPGESFLYWRHPDDPQAAWAAALREDATAFNLPVRPLEVYMVNRARGVSFLEPAREGLPLSVDQGDRRFEDYFLGPRRGGQRAGAAPEAEEP
jgi:GGDEF domain-containing protein